MVIETDIRSILPTPSHPATQSHGLATAALVCGIASFIPLTPPVITPLVAIVLGLLSKPQTGADGHPRRAPRAVAGIVLGCLSLAILATICILYFGVLGYPLPHLQRYHPSS
jgi:Domain of unknown function (DUF4190)